jgi:hypothetical protein
MAFDLLCVCAVCIRHKGRPSYFLSAVANCPVFPIKSVWIHLIRGLFFILLLLLHLL